MDERTEPTAHECAPERFFKVVARSKSYVLDVHIPEQRHIEGTDAFVPYDSIREHRDLLPDEDTPITLYCRSDGMSREVTDGLLEKGYEEVYLLRGGIQAWEDEGLPLSEYRFCEPGVRTDG